VSRVESVSEVELRRLPQSRHLGIIIAQCVQ
jgi:hypothetical protein